MMLAHQTRNPFLLHRHRLHEAQVGLDATVALKRMLRSERLDSRHQTLITLGHLQRPAPRQPNSSSLFLLQEELPDELLEPGVFLLEAGLFLGVVMHLKGRSGMGQKLVPPLIILALAELMLGTDLGDGPALEALKHNHRFGLRILCALLHG
jgi:hypothetical protein